VERRTRRERILSAALSIPDDLLRRDGDKNEKKLASTTKKSAARQQ
jgi:hypothetical protein